mmetsp:Transcript_16368/g.43206  ORF Transcript_16368/g.43206 Transcript_16368/m.43206 type:complete len:126 (+) Transcript_16368:179-556(+)
MRFSEREHDQKSELEPMASIVSATTTPWWERREEPDDEHQQRCAEQWARPAPPAQGGAQRARPEAPAGLQGGECTRWPVIESRKCTVHHGAHRGKFVCAVVRTEQSSVVIKRQLWRRSRPKWRCT